MSTVKLAFYKYTGDAYDRLIKLFTRSKYSHCELIVEGISYSSSPQDGGVRAKEIHFKSDRWDIIDVPGDPKEIVHWFSEHHGQKYDWFGAIKTVFPLSPNYGSKWFCSEACAAALQLKREKWFDPGDLAEYFGLPRK